MKGQALEALAEREKDALRLLSRGYDIKAVSKTLDVSVHVINERLRDARRKLGVTSSREAARLLGELEQESPKLFVDKISGVDVPSDLAPFLLSPDVQAAEDETALLHDREIGDAVSSPLPVKPIAARSLPLRRPGEMRNELSKQERLMAIVDVSTKMAAVFALLCLIALIVNTVAQGV
jgi:DNA-binding CsgD family transcriptional regulator